MTKSTSIDAQDKLENDEDENIENTHQYVSFVVADEIFAGHMAPVQEIIRVPDVVSVPLAPHALIGLANLRGKVLPIISLRRIFGFEDRESDDATRAIVIDLGQPLGFIVDKVASVLDIDSTHLQGVEQFKGAVQSDLLSGILRDVGGHNMMMVLDFAKLIAQEFNIAALNDESSVLASSQIEVEVDEDEDDNELQLVSFKISKEEYAIDIKRVKEIVTVPESIVHIPNCPPQIIGLMTLRENLLPILSLRELFGLPSKEMDDDCRIVVVTLGTYSVGLLTDSVSEVLRVPEDKVDIMPQMLSNQRNMDDITAICRINEGKRLVSIISVEKMFENDVVVQAVAAADEKQDDGGTAMDEHNDDLDVSDEQQIVVFKLAKDEFGVLIESVQEIVRVPEELTSVPKSPHFVEGVINLRGAVLPVIDQRKRMGLDPIERNDRQRIMVFLLSGIRTGFIVDSVTEVLKVNKCQIEAAPKLSSQQAEMVGQVVNLEKAKRMVQIINPDSLMSDSDTESLSVMV